MPPENVATVARIYHGHDGMRQLCRVLVLGQLRVRGKDSGALADTPFGAVAELDDEVVARWWIWTDPTKAREAVGLPA
jgi:hypothetical protein